MGAETPDYMAGHCHVFAVALHRKFGHSFLLMLDKTERYQAGIYGVQHVYAVDSEGWAYDCRGRHRASEVIDQWVFANDARKRYAVRALNNERELQKYVAATEEDWSLPLRSYSDADVDVAMADAARMLADHLPAVPDGSVRPSRGN